MMSDSGGLPGFGEVLGAVLVIQEDGDEPAAEDAEGVGDDGEKEEHGDAGKDARVTSLRMGSTPSARMASICSVTTMEPSSLAMEEALRPAT